MCFPGGKRSHVEEYRTSASRAFLCRPPPRLVLLPPHNPEPRSCERFGVASSQNMAGLWRGPVRLLGLLSLLPTTAAQLDNQLEDCWNECGRQGGECSFCGSGGACCRQGWGGDPAECGGGGCGNFHCCIAAAPSPPSPPVPPPPASPPPSLPPSPPTVPPKPVSPPPIPPPPPLPPQRRWRCRRGRRRWALRRSRRGRRRRAGFGQRRERPSAPRRRGPPRRWPRR